jgi:hypothetical protein
VSKSGDSAQVRVFLSTYPNSLHAPDAHLLLDDLEWSRANRDDIQALSVYTKLFPQGRHVQEAILRIADVTWSRLDKTNAQALISFTTQYPQSPHKNEAQKILDRLSKPVQEPKQPAKEQPAQQEQPSKQRQFDEQAIRLALEQFNAGFQNRQPREVKKIWPEVPGRYIEAMRLPGATFVMSLRPTGSAETAGDRALVPCELTTKTTIRGQLSQTRKVIKVRLQKVGGGWIIVDPLGVAP